MQRCDKNDALFQILNDRYKKMMRKNGHGYKDATKNDASFQILNDRYKK